MPPQLFSRYTFSFGLLDENERLFLTDPEPFPFQAFPDNVQHVVQQGDTLFSLAGFYFAPLPRSSGLWWIIADFQPDPIHDPTLALDIGRTLVIPSVRVVTEEIFSASRQLET